MRAAHQVHLVVCGHDLKALSRRAVRVSRLSSAGWRQETTSLHQEMSVLSSGKEGVARLWNYAPRVMDDGDADCDEGGEADLNSAA